MRSLIAAAALVLLAACGNNNPTTTTTTGEATSGPTIPDEWVGKITANPTIAANYAPTDFKAQGQATATALANGVQVTTNSGLGAFSVIVDLGQAATGPAPKAVRVTVQATEGQLQLVSTYRDFPAGYTPYSTYVAAGSAPTTLYLPVDTHGRAPVLIVANGAAHGTSAGTLTDMQLLTPPG